MTTSSCRHCSDPVRPPTTRKNGYVTHHTTCHTCNNLWSRYKITKSQYQQLLDEQGGACAICKTTEGTLAVDHCHTTGKIRGLLCSHCNTALGKFKDNVQTIESAIAYLNDN